MLNDSFIAITRIRKPFHFFDRDRIYNSFVFIKSRELSRLNTSNIHLGLAPTSFTLITTR